MYALTSMGHTDRFMIVDAGFPIPKEVERIDLTLCAGIPSFMDCLKAILSEVVVEKAVLAEPMAQVNKDTHDAVCQLLKNQPKEYVPQEELLRESYNVKFIVRTAEFAPYSNIMLTSASGVESYYRDFWV